MIDCVLEIVVKIFTTTPDLQALSAPPSMLQVYSRMPQVANRSYAKPAQLFLSGAGWDDALKEAAIPDTKLARKSVRRAIRKLKAEAEAEGPPFRAAQTKRRPKPFKNGTLFVRNGSHGHEL